MQLMQLRKESLKKSGLPGLEPWPLRYRCSALTNWANKPTGSWSWNWFVIYPGKMKMKLWIYDIHIFELRNEEINVKTILAVINATCLPKFLYFLTHLIFNYVCLYYSHIFLLPNSCCVGVLRSGKHLFPLHKSFTVTLQFYTPVSCR